MNTRTYTLSSDTLAAGTAGIDIFETGRTNLIFTLSGIEQTSYHYTKFVFDFGDGTSPVVLQDPSNVKALSGKSVSHIFTPTESNISSYKISVAGYTTKGTVDYYYVNLGVGKSHITDYRDVKIINSHLFTSKDGKNNLFLTLEAQNPRFLANLIIPYDPDEGVYLPEVPVTGAIDLQGIYLRTEIYTNVGGEVAIVGEHTGAYFIREHDLIVFVIGSEVHSQWSGSGPETGPPRSIAIVLDDNVTITDINGVEISPNLLLVPETSVNETEDIDDVSYTAVPSDKNLPYRYK